MALLEPAKPCLPRWSLTTQLQLLCFAQTLHKNTPKQSGFTQFTENQKGLQEFTRNAQDEHLKYEEH